MKSAYITRKVRHAAIAACALLASGTFTSCDDMLDLKPQGQFTAEQLDNETVEGLLAAAYAGLGAHFFGNNEAFAGPSTNWIFDVRSDDAYKGGGALSMEGNIHELEMGNVQSDNVSIFNKWQNNFYAVSRCNKAIDGVNSSSVTGKENYIGQLKTLRAYYYFDLIRCFDRIPYFTENDDPNEARYDQYTRQEILGFIKADLADAYENLLPATQEKPGAFNKYVAAAIHAKVSAFTSSWDEVEYYANEVITSGQYELYRNFLDMSKTEFNNSYESIMALQVSTANNYALANWSNMLNTTYSEGNLYGTGDDFFLASQNLVNAFRTDENGLPYLDGTFNDVKVTTNYDGTVDPRLDFTVGRIGMPFRGYTYNMKWTRAYDLYGEYSGKKGLVSPDDPQMLKDVPWGAAPLNFIFIRYADILLLKAEALIEQNKNLGDARELINSVRRKAARSVDASYTPVDCNPMIASYYVAEYPEAGWTQDYARRAVRMERRLELAMEGHRWFDLVRWGNVVETMNDYYVSEAKVREYYKGATLSQNEVLFPVPLTEVQNAGGLYN